MEREIGDASEVNPISVSVSFSTTSSVVVVATKWTNEEQRCASKIILNPCAQQRGFGTMLVV